MVLEGLRYIGNNAEGGGRWVVEPQIGTNVEQYVSLRIMNRCQNRMASFGSPLTLSSYKSNVFDSTIVEK